MNFATFANGQNELIENKEVKTPSEEGTTSNHIIN